MDTDNKQIGFLVCVSASPSSAKIIERTARMARAFDSGWVALYVETPDTLKLGAAANESLKGNIALAKRLGGEFVQVEGLDIASSVVEYARQANITDIVIGKSRNRKTLKSYFEKSLEEQIITLSENIEVHIVPDTGGAPRVRTPKAKFRFKWADVLKTLLLLAAATGICFALWALGVSETNFILIYALTVILISLFTGGYVYSIASSVICVLLFDFLFVEPYYTFHLMDTDYIFILITMFAVSVVMGMVTSRIIIRSAHAIKREKHLEDLHFLSRNIIRLQRFDEIVSLFTEYFRTRLKLNAVVYTAPFAAPADVTEETVNYVFEKGVTAGRFTKINSGIASYYLPVAADDKVLAVVGIFGADGAAAEEPDEEERTFMKMAIAQFALAMEKQIMLNDRKEALVSMEREKTRSNLLRSVSHDLRTPLTAIYGSASTIVGEDLDPGTVKELARDICEDSGWLIRMVENLLLVTKLNGADVVLKKQSEAAEEIIAQAVYKVKTRSGYNDIKVSVPEELILVPMDGMLIEQVIINLLDNAVKYSESKAPIEVCLRKSGGNAVIGVSDSGKGIDASVIDAVSGKGADVTGNAPDGKKGMGIGLSLCYTIVKAHGGRITAGNKATGGAEFEIILPLEETK